MIPFNQSPGVFFFVFFIMMLKFMSLSYDLLYSGAMAIQGSTKVVTPFLRTGLDFHAEGSGVVNFITDVQFSSLPPLFCLQMMQEPLRYR